MNLYKPFWAKIKKIKNETNDIRLFVLELENEIKFNVGQFALIGVQGFGEAPFDICSPTKNGKQIEIVVRRVGILTQKIFKFDIGDSFTFRGPYGNGFPPLESFKNRNLLMLGGGTGMIVIRGLIQEMLETDFNPKGKAQIFYGARDWDSFLFRDEFKEWEKKYNLHLILEDIKGAKMACGKGMITGLFDVIKIAENPKVIMCGPPVMYTFCVQQIVKKIDVLDKDIFMSLERRMHCGIGVCQHCAIGEKYVCKDGTVFTYEELKKIPGAL